MTNWHRSAASLAFIALACTPHGWRQVPTIGDLTVARPCNTDTRGSVWSDSLPLVSDTTQQHIVSGRSALVPPADQATSYVAGMVRARFAIDTLGNVISGSSIIEASSDERYAQLVCQALPHLKFAPVVIDGRKTVAGLVHVPFAFEVN
jgi:hypothetical protein